MKAIVLSLCFSLIAFFAPIGGLLVLVGATIFSDTVVGLYSSYRLKTPIISKKLSRIASKMLIYEGAILLIFAMDKMIINEITAITINVPYIITKFTSLMLVSIECFSIDEKIRNFNNGKGTAFYFKQFMKLTKSLKNGYDEISDKKD